MNPKLQLLFSLNFKQAIIGTKILESAISEYFTEQTSSKAKKPPAMATTMQLFPEDITT